MRGQGRAGGAEPGWGHARLGLDPRGKLDRPAREAGSYPSLSDMNARRPDYQIGKHETDWTWCPRVAAHEITRSFLISQARLQKARQTLEAYGRDLDDLLEAFADLPLADLIEADSGQLEIYLDGLYNRPPKHGASSQANITRITKTPLSLSTIRRRVGTARRFYQWLIDRN